MWYTVASCWIFLYEMKMTVCFPVNIADIAGLAILTAMTNIEAFWAVMPRLLFSNYHSIRRHFQEYFNLIRRLSETGDRPHASEELGLRLNADPSRRAF